MGAIPPMNDQQWNEAFDKYKQIAQYKYINSSFTLHDFKFIFFWEWFHRLWARLMGIAFIIPFTIFLIQKRIKKEMVRPLVILFLLGGLLGLIGWLMVATGLDDQHLYVSHYMLAFHFNLGLGTICYAFWLALTFLLSREELIGNNALRNFTGMVDCSSCFAIDLWCIHGRIEGGSRMRQPGRTSTEGFFLTADLHHQDYCSFLITPSWFILFIATLGYLIFLLIIAWYFRSKKVETNLVFRKTSWLPLAIVTLQLILGIFTVIVLAVQKSSYLVGRRTPVYCRDAFTLTLV